MLCMIDSIINTLWTIYIYMVILRGENVPIACSSYRMLTLAIDEMKGAVVSHYIYDV